MPVSEPQIEPGPSEHEPEMIIATPWRSVTRRQHFSTHVTNTTMLSYATDNSFKFEMVLRAVMYTPSKFINTMQNKRSIGKAYEYCD
jgi:hypothetical protein